MNKYVFLALSAFVAFNFHVSASEDVEQDVASVGMPTTNQQPLMLTYDPKWHAASEADRKLYNPEIATLYPELPIRDVYGLHGLVYKMNQIPDKHSYLYKVTKGPQSFLLFGTIHVLPLFTLPSFVKDTVFSCQTLICERIMADKSKFNSIIDKYCDESHDWFDDLLTREQNILKDLRPLFNSENELYKAFKFDIRVMRAMYSQMHFTFSMDSETKRYFNKNSRFVCGLETQTEIRDFFAPCLKKDKEQEFYFLRVLLKMTTDSAGFLQQSFVTEAGADYLSRNYFKEQKENHNFSENHKWWLRLNELLIDNPRDACVAVGLGHCLKEGGLLDFAFQDGWTVEKCNEPFPWDNGRTYSTQAMEHKDILL